MIESGVVRPINTIKIYGANTGKYGTTRDAQERFWRNILGGIGTTRFHRPPAGLGLSVISKAHIRSMRMALMEHDIFRSEPRMELLVGQTPWSDEAYCSAIEGESYLIFFPAGGEVTLRISKTAEEFVWVQWLDIRKSAWTDRPQLSEQTDNLISLATPTEEGYWAAVVQVK